VNNNDCIFPVIAKKNFFLRPIFPSDASACTGKERRSEGERIFSHVSPYFHRKKKEKTILGRGEKGGEVSQTGTWSTEMIAFFFIM